jgi:hypothetical protein
MIERLKTMPWWKRILMGFVVFPWATLMAGAALLVNLADKIAHCFGGCFGF